jgi:hypothetical protein
MVAGIIATGVDAARVPRGDEKFSPRKGAFFLRS